MEGKCGRKNPPMNSYRRSIWFLTLFFLLHASRFFVPQILSFCHPPSRSYGRPILCFSWSSCLSLRPFPRDPVPKPFHFVMFFYYRPDKIVKLILNCLTSGTWFRTDGGRKHLFPKNLVPVDGGK